MSVLAIYDLRGIQDFIFRTNKLREVIGGSTIVAGLLEEALAAFVETRPTAETHVLNWHNDNIPLPFRMLSDDKVDSEILYCGGGNLLVAWKTADLAQSANRYMSHYVLEHAYSLSLSCATTPMSSDYRTDYTKLCQNLDFVKSIGYRPMPISGCPFTYRELDTNLPAVVRDGTQRISQETHLKRIAAKQIYRSQGKEGRFSLYLDDMTDDAEKNFIAVVHIDGNSMGQRIRQRLETCTDYADAVFTMRALSLRIVHAFGDSLMDAIDAVCVNETNHRLPLRPVIAAGDDITFICRADLALPMTKAFINRVEQKAMCDKSDGTPDLENYAFSACAGIVFTHAHFPFSEAYFLCEQLCSAAKTKAKLPENAIGQSIGSYVDFHIENGAILNSLEELREQQYRNGDGSWLLQRPLNINGEHTDSLNHFFMLVDKFRNIPRTWLKRARNAYELGDNDILEVFKRAAVYGERTLGDKPFDEQHHALYFDALEMLDVIGKEEEE